MNRTIIFGIVVSSFLAASLAQSTKTIIKNAKQAVESGDVDIDRDIKPLIDALKSSRSEDEQDDLVEAIEDLGAGSGSSPRAVKQYLLDEATPLFLEIGKNAKDVFLRGGVFLALRDLGAPRSVLEEAATIAEADPEPYVQSRGEIIRNYLSSLPEAAEVSDIREVDPEQEKAALAFLKTRRLGASMDQLRISSQNGNVEEVHALINAGVQVNPDEGRTPLTAAVFSGCGTKGGDTPELIETVKVLLAAGAQVNRPDDNANIALIHAAQMCGPGMLEALIAGGSEINYKNQTGISALGLAFIMQKLDSVSFLIEKGARLDADESKIVESTATSDEAKALFEKAKGS